MKSQRKRRLYFIFLLITAVSVSVGLALFALRQNINLYYTPSELLSHNISSKQAIRIGGLLVKGSVHHQSNTLNVSFVLTDYHHKILVTYDGILPSLFREGQGVVAQGHLQSNGTFKADQVLAKHDENYHPPHLSATHS